MTLKICENGVLRNATPDELAQHELDVAAALKKRAEHERIKYQRDRAAEYPPIGDQLDALWKGGDAATAMLDQVQAVKAKYPKPQN